MLPAEKKMKEIYLKQTRILHGHPKLFLVAYKQKLHHPLIHHTEDRTHLIFIYIPRPQINNERAVFSQKVRSGQVWSEGTLSSSGIIIK